MTDVLGGTIPLVYTAVAGAHGHIKSGKLKAIAVSSAQRTSALPDVPRLSRAVCQTLSSTPGWGCWHRWVRLRRSSRDSTQN